MVELIGWKKIVVPQRNYTGCIPTGYEWLIRYLHIEGVDLDTFQDEFDLGQENNFQSVGQKIIERYPHVNIKFENFEQGIEKIRVITDLIGNQKPCLISLALTQGGWHIMPVVRVDKDSVRIIHDGNGGRNTVWVLKNQDIIWRHHNIPGGKDIAWIET